MSAVFTSGSNWREGLLPGCVFVQARIGTLHPFFSAELKEEGGIPSAD